ncbi:MAG: hypothetical protein PUE33_05270 [bacterium]|nr:hypothetical protein [bacterium]
MIGQEQLRVNTKEQIPTVPYFDGVNGDQSFSSDDSFKNLKSSKIIPFRHKEIDSITLNEWLQSYRTNNQLQNLFVNMDIAMKYIHDQGYYISSFALDRISLLNHSIRQIQFQELAPLPYDISQQKQVVRDNIFMASVLHIGLYAKCLQHFTMNTIPAIKDNFQQFTIFLPPEDVPYYSGIIEKGASVYYSAYVGERKKRDLQNLEKEVSSGENNSSGKRLVKTNGSAYTAEDFLPQNEEANELIYASLVKKEAAFARALIYPILVFVLGFVILFLSYLFR